MDSIVTTALVGTARQAQVDPRTGTPVDELTAELPEGEVERKFLLSAGAWAVYRQAGVKARELADTPVPAGEEKLRECSPGAALLLSRLLNGEQSELLPEALACMSERGLRLPYRLLPRALSMSGKETRAALFPLLGERGRWLSQFNSSWAWVQNYLAVDESGLPADAETIWQEGTPGQRVEILRLLRAVDANKAREWLDAVWKQEKADARNDLLKALEIGLNAADEPFLELALDDRSAGVRATSARLLGLLPDSAWSQRMRERGRGVMNMVNGRIRLELPAAFEKDWQRDGIVEQSPKNVSKRGWWLIQILAGIQPAFWETHLGASPAELLTLLPADTTWQTQIIEGWTKATINYRAVDWMTPLWSWWYEHYQKAAEEKNLTDYTYREQLLQCMPAAQAEQLMLDLIERKDGHLPANWWELAPELSRPWGAELARVYLRLLREHCTPERMQAKNYNSYNDPWISALSVTALVLPVACFAEALQPWELPEDNDWRIQFGCHKIQEFIETVSMRQKIHEEIV